MIRKSLTHPSFWLILLGVTLVLSGCGSSSVTTKGTNKNAQQTASPITELPTTPPSSFDNGIPSKKFSFEVYGESPSMVGEELTTDNLLQVRVTAQMGGKNRGTNQYTNFAANYGCVTFKVFFEMDQGSGWVKIAEQTTSALSVPGTSGCTNGKAEEVINFSKYLFPGEKRVRLKVQAMQSDFYCILYTKCENYIRQYRQVPNDCTWMAGQLNMSQYVCPLKDIYQYHTVNGTLDMQTNGTAL